MEHGAWNKLDWLIYFAMFPKYKPTRPDHDDEENTYLVTKKSHTYDT